MKALLDIGDDGRLQVTLHGEGRNDATLLSMLLQQYPALIQGDGGDVEVPIAQPHLPVAKTSPGEVLALNVDYNFYAHSWVGVAEKVRAPILGAEVDASELPAGLHLEVVVNGRETIYSLDDRGEKRMVFDLYPGYAVKMRVSVAGVRDLGRAKFQIRIRASR